MSLETPTSHPEKFFSSFYHCSKCDYTAEIFLNKNFSLYNICNSNSICGNCGIRKPIVCNGDLIIRKDWPNADNDPWQIQCAYIADEDGYCKDCEHCFTGDYKMLMVACPICDEQWMSYKNTGN